MSLDEFQIVVDKIRPFTNYIYLHVLGEPLLHPHLDEILTIAESAELNINITTNGGLLERKQEILLKHSIRQINVSLHDAEENIVPEKWMDFLDSAFNFTTKAAPDSYVCLRLWNTSNESSNDFNSFCLKQISERFNLSVYKLMENTNGNGLKLAEHIFLQRAPRFEWPDGNQQGTQVTKKCYALRDHIAILADGQIVPCCLDADANMLLGNIFTNDLDVIINSDRVVKMREGFSTMRITEEFCKSCGFTI